MPRGPLCRRRSDARSHFRRHGVRARSARPRRRVRCRLRIVGRALNAAYFLAGQATRGTTIYYEDINTRGFIDLHRPLRNRPILNLDFLMKEVLRHRKRLDVDRVLAARAALSILATDVATAATKRFRNFADEDDLIGAMRASATMPIVAGGPLTFRGGRYFDASLTEPIPVPTAEADGNTHVLVLLTRPNAEPRSLSSLDRLFVIPRLRRLSPQLATRFIDRSEPYAALLKCIDAGTGPLGRAVVQGIRPLPPAVGRLERRRIAARGRRGGRVPRGHAGLRTRVIGLPCSVLPSRWGPHGR